MTTQDLQVSTRTKIEGGAAATGLVLLGGAALTIWLLTKGGDKPGNGNGDHGTLGVSDTTFSFLGPLELCTNAEGVFALHIEGTIQGTGWFMARFWHLSPGAPQVIESVPLFVDQAAGPFVADLGNFIVPPFTFPPSTTMSWQGELVESDETGKTVFALLDQGLDATVTIAC